MLFVLLKIYRKQFVMDCQEAVKQMTDIQTPTMISEVYGKPQIALLVLQSKKKYMKLHYQVGAKFYHQVVGAGYIQKSVLRKW